MRFLLLIVHLHLPPEHPNSIYMQLFSDLQNCELALEQASGNSGRFARCYELMPPGRSA